MIYNRKCPICSKNIFYMHKRTYNRAIKINSNCDVCAAIKRGPRSLVARMKQYESMKGKNRGAKSEDTKRKISLSLVGRQMPNETRAKLSKKLKIICNAIDWKRKRSFLSKGENNGMYGKHHSLETKQKMSSIIKNIMNSPIIKDKMNKIHQSKEYRMACSKSFTGRKFSVEHCKNLRLAHIKRIKEIKCNGRDLTPRCNPEACKIIDEYGKQYGYNFRHAMNGGEYYIKELGYWIDGYDRERNTIIEVDESHHYDFDGNLKEKDKVRQKNISEFLKCSFIRIPINKTSN